LCGEIGRKGVAHCLSPSDGERLIWVRAPSLARALALYNVGERGGVTNNDTPDYKNILRIFWGYPSNCPTPSDRMGA